MKLSFLVKGSKLFFKFGFAFAIIAYMIYSDRLDLQVVKRGFSSSGTLILATLFVVIASSLCFYRWNLLLRAQNMHFGFWPIVRYSFIGIFFSTTMPGIVSGDVIKAWYILKDRPPGQSRTPILMSIFLDRFMGLFGLITVSVIALFFNWTHAWDTQDLKKVATTVLLLAAGMLCFFAYIMLSMWGPLAGFRRKMQKAERHSIGRLFLKVYDAWISYREAPRTLAATLVTSVFTHCFVISSVIFCAHALGERSIPLYQYFMLVPIGLLTTAIPIAPAGLGVGHVAFAALFRIAGSNYGAEIFTLYVTLQIALNLTGVIFYVRSPRPAVENQIA